LRKDLVFRQLDQYCRERFVEIGKRKLERPILKSYVFEASRFGAENMDEFGALGVLRKIDDDLAELVDNDGPIGYVENMRRFSVLYTFLPTSDIEPELNRLLRDSHSLDSLWLSGDVFRVLFGKVKDSFGPSRFVRVAMGHSPVFEVYDGYRRGARPEYEAMPIVADRDDRFEEELEESLASRVHISNRLERLGYLVDLVAQAEEFRNMSMLRIPAMSTSGGHEFYHNGKVTNRSGDFLDHRNVLKSVIGMYGHMTEALEDEVWLDLENTDEAPIGNNLRRFAGSPVILTFRRRLAPAVFKRFLDLTFEKGKGPFKLWGNLLDRGKDCYHFYGLDLHLIQEIFLEVTPSRILAFLPRGTCGNTIHRLVTNVQRYLAPDVTVFIGDKSYTDFAEEAFRGIGSSESTDSG